MSEQIDLKVVIRWFVGHQKQLLSSFLKSRRQPVCWRGSDTGCVQIENEIWLFRMHGAGIGFKNWDGVLIDAHTNPTIPDGVDWWRISQFIETSGLANEFGGIDIQSELDELCKLGEIGRTNDPKFFLATC